MYREYVSRVWIGLRGEVVSGNPLKRERCLFDAVDPPEGSGTGDVNRVEATGSVPRYTFVDAGVVAALDVLDAPWLRVRAYGGAAGVAFKPVLPLYYGVEVYPHIGGFHLAVSVEQWRWSVRMDSVQYRFQNGVLTSRTARGFDDVRTPIYIRVTTVSGFGGRGPR